MKRLSLKTRLVLLHNGMMALVVCIVLALLFSISSREIVSNVENTLEASVFGAFEDMEYEDGRLDFDSDLMNLEDGVYLSVYDKNSQELLYGRIPYGFAYDLPFESGNLRTITAGENDYSVLDLEHTVNGRPVLIRGVISISDAEWTIMKALWQSKDKKMTLKEIAEAVSDAGWSYTTVRTMVGRLVEKEAIAADESHPRNFRYSAAVTEEACRKEEMQSFINRIFDGSAKLLVSSLVSGKNLSKEEQQTLLEIIEKME